MIKKILILFFVMLLTGCTAEYKLNIDDEYIEESISIKVDEKKLGKEGLKILKDSQQKVNKNVDQYYTQDIIEKNDKINIKYNYTYETDSFSSSNFISECYTNNYVSNTQDLLTIKTEGNFSCYNRYGSEIIKNSKIVITTNLNVIDNNADKVKGNVYTWIIDESNYYDKPIYIKIEKQHHNFSFSLEFLLIFIVVTSILIIIFYLFIKHKNKKINEF